MDALRTLCESRGFEAPQTYIQSGNVVFRTQQNPEYVATQLEEGIRRQFGFHSDTLLRKTDEMRAIVAANPFAGRTDVPGNKLLVRFLRDEPRAAACMKVLALARGPEELHFAGRELFVYFPDGMGRSKLPLQAMAKELRTAGTGRNWNTVLKLLQMAERLENNGVNS